METNEQLNKSTRTFEEWRASLMALIIHKKGVKAENIFLNDEKVKPYYDQGLMPDVCYQELFNR